YRTTDGIAEVLETIGRFGDAVAIVIPIIGVEHLVPPEVVAGPMEFIGTALDGDVHLASRARAKLRLRARPVHPDLAYRVDIWGDETGTRRESHILVGDAVQRHQKLTGLAAVYLRRAGAAWCVPVVEVQHPGEHAEQAEIIAASVRNVFDLRGCDQTRALGTG